MVNHLPNLVGLSLGAATSVLNSLDLPVMVLVNNTVVEGAPSTETVVAQSPSAGIGMGCQCAVGLTVSSAT
jgi:beta-lactam-binding protein with PASTA domain